MVEGQPTLKSRQLLNKKFKLKKGLKVLYTNPDEVIIAKTLWSGEIYHLYDKEGTGKLARIIRFLEENENAQTKEIIKEVGEKKAVLNVIKELLTRNCLEEIKESTFQQSLLHEFFDATIGDVKAAERIKSCNFLLIGAGLLGTRVAMQLAAIGVKSLGIMDDSNVKPSDPILNQIYRKQNSERKRSEILADYLKNMTEVDVFPILGISNIIEKRELESILKKIDYVLVLFDLPHIFIYEKINEAALKTRTIWTLATFDGNLAFVGPTFVPYETACYVCFENRLRSSLSISDHNLYLAFKEKMKTHHVKSYYPPLPPMISDFMSGLVGIEVLSEMSLECLLAGKFCAIHIPTLTLEINNVLKLPRCPACGKNKPSRQVYLTMREVIRLAKGGKKRD